MPDNDEELVVIRLKKNTWYHATLVDNPLTLTKLSPKIRRHRLYVRLSHNEYSFFPDSGGSFRMLSTNLTGCLRDGPITDPTPVAVCSGDVRILEEYDGEPERIYVGHFDEKFGGHIK